jgi:hypothetical protein
MTFPGIYDNECVYIKCSSSDNACLQGKVTTTDGTTAFTLIDIPIPKNTAMRITSRVLGTRIGGTSGTAGNSWAYDVFTKAKNINNTITVLPINITKFGDNNIPVISYIPSGQNMRVTIVGVAGNNIKWTSTHCIIFTSY